MRMSHSGACPCHTCQSARGAGLGVAKAGLNMLSKHNAQGGRSFATPVDQAVQKEYAFEVSATAWLMQTKCAVHPTHF